MLPHRQLPSRRRSLDGGLGRVRSASAHASAPSRTRPLARDLLSPSRLRRQGLFDADFVARLQDEHERGTANHFKPLWTLLMFELWRENFLPHETDAFNATARETLLTPVINE